MKIPRKIISFQVAQNALVVLAADGSLWARQLVLTPGDKPTGWQRFADLPDEE